MSSFARRLQIRLFEKRGQRQIPVLNVETGNVMKWLWPLVPSQLAYSADGVPLFADTKHPTLQPIIDILAANQSRLKAAA